MNIEKSIINKITEAIKANYNIEVLKNEILLSKTKKDFKGDFTFNIFNLSKKLKQNPKEISAKIAEYLMSHSTLFSDFNIVGGFINLSINDKIWIQELLSQYEQKIAFNGKENKIAVIEYPSPNTNKPLHLGHLRNMFLGKSISNILKYIGYKVYDTNLINDRGIHICKSMIAYQKFGNNETPESTGIKGDHLVGKYYIEFEKEYKKEIKVLNEKLGDPKKAVEASSLMKETQEMLLKWENNDEETIKLWNKMNNWVYDGFNETFNKLNIKFDRTYYESDTYLLGKNIVEEGLNKGVFYRKKDNSVWIDLEKEGLDNKLVLRADGTSVYITQDLGNADQRYLDFKFDKSIYVVGNEQDYHFNVLFKILEKLDKKYAKKMFHLSYGMVDLPSGKMKSREGTVVDADNLIEEMIELAKKNTIELGKIDNFDSKEAKKLYETLGLGALKYFLLKIEPQKRMLFDPKNSIDFHGDTGPFIQYTFARISTLLKKAEEKRIEIDITLIENLDLEHIEKEIISHVYSFSKYLFQASEELCPSYIAQFVLHLAKLYNKLYADFGILNETNKNKKSLRLLISSITAKKLELGLSLLGINAPKKM